MVEGEWCTNYANKQSVQRYMEVTSVLNTAFVILTLYLIKKEGKTLKPDYRQVLLINLLLPATFSFYMGFIYQPYIVFPYHLLLTVGFFRFGPFVTAHLFNICCSLAILCSMGFIYSFWFNYITICFRISRQNSRKSNLMGMTFGIVFTVFNFLLMTIGVDSHQFQFRDDLYRSDSRIQTFFDEYSIAIVKVDDKWSLKVKRELQERADNTERLGAQHRSLHRHYYCGDYHPNNHFQIFQNTQ